VEARVGAVLVARLRAAAPVARAAVRLEARAERRWRGGWASATPLDNSAVNTIQPTDFNGLKRPVRSIELVPHSLADDRLCWK
jgi:hypothetical protein